MRTSKIMVTDQGAMFGVIVGPSGEDQANVLHGNVELRFVSDAGARPQVVPLGDYEWARVEEPGTGGFASVIRCPIAPRPPAGSAPVPAAATETGSGSASRAAGFVGHTRDSGNRRPRQGLPRHVVDVRRCVSAFAQSDGAGHGGVARFLHRAQLCEGDSFQRQEPAGARMHRPNTSDQFGEFSVAEGLVEGQNRWEIDVVETNPSDTASSPLTILQMEIGGRVDLLSGAKQAAPATAPPRGEREKEKKK